MLLIKLINYLKGYLLVSVDGYFLERFINMCIRHEIFIWDIHKMSSAKMRVKMSVKAFRMIRPIAARTKSRIRIYRRRGVPFTIHKYRKRRGIVVGLCLFIAMMVYFSAFISGLEITGNERIATEVIEEHLAEFGVRAGRPVRGIDIPIVQNRMMTAIPELSWIGINVRGSKVFIDIQERNIIPERIPEDVPCNLIATRGGVIELMNVRSGFNVVNINEAVSAGDLLVSGIIDSEAGVRYVHSFGEVFARTWYEAAFEYSFNFDERLDTGRERNKRAIRLGNLQINLHISRRVPYTVYERTRTVSAHRIPVLGTLQFVRNNFREQRIVPQTRTLDEILALADTELREKIEEQLPPDIEVLDVQTTYEFVTSELIRVTMIYTCRENIAMQALIGLEAMPPMADIDAAP